MSDCGLPANVGSMEGLGGWVPVGERLPAAASNDWLGPMVEGEAYHEWLTAPPPDAMRCVDTRAAFAAGWSAAVAAERERCALIAVNGCLVPPDGGLPTDDERLLCDEIARRIRGA